MDQFRFSLGDKKILSVSERPVKSLGKLLTFYRGQVRTSREIQGPDLPTQNPALTPLASSDIRRSYHHRGELQKDDKPLPAQVAGPTTESQQHCPLWAQHQAAVSIQQSSGGVQGHLPEKSCSTKIPLTPWSIRLVWRLELEGIGVARKRSSELRQGCGTKSCWAQWQLGRLGL